MRDITALLSGDLDPHARPRARGAERVDLHADWLARLPEPDARGRIRTGTPETTEAVMSSVRRSAALAQFQRPKLLTPEQHAALKLVRRASERETGLSNAAYLAASSGTQKITVKITPARVKFTISDPLADLASSAPGPAAGGGRRGVVREFSDGARDRLADRAAELEAEGKVPQFMGTFTAPANWEEIYLHDSDRVALEGGRIFKQHLEALRKRLDRKLQRLGVHHWAALWFLEFQERGAPHVHLIVFDCVIDGKKRAALRSWSGRAWADICGNPSPHERGKHQRAGTQIAKMKKKHFGYAMKYASKMQQKAVPEGFHGVGRFWGVWNCKRAAPVVVDLDYSRLDGQEAAWVSYLVANVLGTVAEFSADFVTTRTRKLENALLHGIKHKFGFSVYGSAASQTARDFITKPIV